MEGQLIGGVVATHSPRMAANEPAFMTPLADGARQMGAALRALEPDALIVMSTHWVSTFHWYAGCQARHSGQCVATEAPDIIPGLPYDRPGDPQLGQAIAEAVTARLASTNGAPESDSRCGRNETPHYVWDYGTLVPLLYMDPKQRLPIVPLSTCIGAGLEECLAVGEAVREAVAATGRRAVFVASGALSHRLVRAQQAWPLLPARQLDERFCTLARDGNVAELRQWLPEFAQGAEAEMGGRHLAVLLGALDAEERAKHGTEPRAGTCWTGSQFGYGQSFGSGNTNLLICRRPE